MIGYETIYRFDKPQMLSRNKIKVKYEICGKCFCINDEDEQLYWINYV